MAVTLIDGWRQIKSASITNTQQNFGTPSAAGDVAIKSYVDWEILNLKGLSNVKNAARVATTTNGTLSTAYANGQTVDGVTLTTGDRILLKDQTTQTENGLYTVNVSGVPTRATDADTAAEIKDMIIFIEAGTANADKWFKLTNDGTITLGSTNLTYAAFTGGGLTTSNWVDRETPSGAVNGSNTSFTLAFTPSPSGSEHVYLNGVLQESGAGNDYTISGLTITYLAAPVSGDKIRVSYRK